MKAFFCIAALVLAAPTLAIASDASVHVLAIGVSTYEFIEDDATFADDDALVFAETVRKICGDQECHISYLLNGDATLLAIREAMDGLSKAAEEDDVVFVYFAGHGSHVPDKDGDEEGNDTRDETLVPFDGEEDRPLSQLLDDDLGMLTSRIQAKTVIVVLDACFSGGQSRYVRGLSSETQQAVFGDPFSRDILSRSNRRGRIIWAACTDEQLARASDELRGGVFTHYLVQELVAAAGQRSGKSLEQVARDARRSVIDYTQGWGVRQTPVFLNPSRVRIDVLPGGELAVRGSGLFVASRAVELGAFVTGDALGISGSLILALNYDSHSSPVYLRGSVTTFPESWAPFGCVSASVDVLSQWCVGGIGFYTGVGMGVLYAPEPDESEILALGSLGFRTDVPFGGSVGIEVGIGAALGGEYEHPEDAWMSQIKLTVTLL